MRFIQLYHPVGPNKLPKNIAYSAATLTQPSAADPDRERGPRDDTLVVAIRPHCVFLGALTAVDYGRDHHPRCFTIWMAGGGTSGITYGETDDYRYNIARRIRSMCIFARDDSAAWSITQTIQAPGRHFRFSTTPRNVSKRFGLFKRQRGF